MMDEEQTVETNPVPMYETMDGDQMGNKENVYLRTLVGDPNRHTPMIDHRPPSTISAQDKQLSSMYTIDTRYQPIPARVLPKTEEPRVYYIDSSRFEEPSFIEEHGETPRSMRLDSQATMPTVFLESKIISQPILYSIVSGNTSPRIDPPIQIYRQPPTPEIYSIAGRPRRPTVDMTSNNSEAPMRVVDQSPTFYSVIGTPRHQNVTQPPTKPLAQLSPNVYSIVGSPARTSRGVQVGPSDSTRPSPVLYTIVDDISDPKNKPKEINSPAMNRKSQPLEPTVYKLQNELSSVRTQQQPISKPALYTLIGKPISPAEEHRAIPPARKRTPPPPTTTIVNRRGSHSLERKPDPMMEPIIIQAPIKKPIIPKSEMISIPAHEPERHRLPQVPRQASPEHIQRKPYTPAQYQPIQLPDYQSPYANRKYKPYRERKYNNPVLPVIARNQSERKPRPPLYEPRYRVDRHHPYDGPQSKSTERYPVSSKSRGGPWDNGYQTQTDDDEDFEQRINRKKRSYKTGRARAPWVPVW